MIDTENKLSALVHQKATQGGGKRCQFTFDKEVKRWRAKKLFYQFSKGDSSQLIFVDTFSSWCWKTPHMLKSKCTLLFVVPCLSGSALDKWNFWHTRAKVCCTPTDSFSCCKKGQNVAWGFSPLNLHVWFSCKYLLQSRAWLLSPHTNKYSLKSIDLRVQIASSFSF